MSAPRKNEDLEGWIRYKVGELKKGNTDVLFSLRSTCHPLINQLVLPLLDDEESAIRKGAVRSLASAGNREVLEPLFDTLSTDDGPEAAEALSYIGDSDAIEPLIVQLSLTPEMAGLRAALARLKAVQAVPVILDVEDDDLFSAEAIIALGQLPAPEAVPKLRETLVRLGDVAGAADRFDTLWYNLKKGLELAGWVPDRSLSGVLVRSYRDLSVLAEAGTAGLQWLLDHWTIWPEYLRFAAQSHITERYQHGSSEEVALLQSIRNQTAAFRDDGSHIRLNIPFHYYFAPAEERPNLLQRCELYRSMEDIEPARPHVPVMLRGNKAAWTFDQTVEQREVVKMAGADLFADLTLRIEPTRETRDILVINRIEESRLHPIYTRTILEVVYRVFLLDGVDGIFVGGLKIVLVDGREHPVDSKPIAFYRATMLILRAILERVEMQPFD